MGDETGAVQVPSKAEGSGESVSPGGQTGGVDVVMGAPPVASPPAVPPPPPAVTPKETVYVNNLNEKISRRDLMHGLREVFEQYGLILEIVCYTKIQRCKGQAWVVFDKLESAKEAVANLNDFWFFGKPLRVTYARKTSDATLRKLGKPVPVRVRPPKRKKSSMKETDKPSDSSDTTGTVGTVADGGSSTLDLVSQASNDDGSGVSPTVISSGKNPSNVSSSAMQSGSTVMGESHTDVTMTDASGNSNAGLLGSGVTTTTVSAPPEREKRRKVARRRDAAPNKMLFVEGLPVDRTEEELKNLFGRYRGFSKVTLIESKPTIAFVEYVDMFHAAPAVESIHGYDLRGSLICVSYAAQ